MWPITGSIADRRPQFAFDGAEDAALLPRDKDAAWILRRVTAVSFVDIGPLDLAAGEILGVLDAVPQGAAASPIVSNLPDVSRNGRNFRSADRIARC